MLESFPGDGLAVVVGATGGIGAALLAHLAGEGSLRGVVGLGRGGDPPLDLTAEETIARAAAHVAGTGRELRLVVEMSWLQLDPAHMAKAFAVNAIGPALLMKHFLPLLPRDGKSVFATLSASAGSIGG